MIVHRPANTRGNIKTSFINTYRTFSFTSYNKQCFLDSQVSMQYLSNPSKTNDLYIQYC